MKLAITGSRSSDIKSIDNILKRWMLKYGSPNEIISGDNKGFETIIKKWAIKNCIPITVFSFILQKDDENKKLNFLFKHSTHVIFFNDTIPKNISRLMKKYKKNKVWLYNSSKFTYLK